MTYMLQYANFLINDAKMCTFALGKKIVA